jgi:hypothetical protein
MSKVIQITPVRNGKQAIYSGITLAGQYTPDPADAERDSYALPVGTFELVPTKIKTR